MRRASCAGDPLVHLAEGLDTLHPVLALCQPVHRRVARDQLPFVGPPAVPPAGIYVLEEVERVDAATRAVIERWLRSPVSFGLVLVGSGEDPLFELLTQVHGSGALVRQAAPFGALGDLPEEVIALALLDSPTTLEGLAAALGKTPLRVRAALLQARLRGISVDTEPLQIDPQLRTAVRRAEAGGRAALTDLQRAHRAVALGAWELALDIHEHTRERPLEAAALCWAMGDLATAQVWVQRSGDARAAAVLAWDMHAPLATLLPLLEALPSPERELAQAAAAARSGDVEGAGAQLTDILDTLEGEHRVDALHMLAKLPLMGPGSLVVGRRFAGEAYQALSSEDAGGQALLRETTARLTLRARNVREAAKQFSQALPLLEEAGHSVPFARAVAGLARSADLVGRTDVLLTWLGRAVRLNRDRPHGLTWCNAALDILMERVEVEDGPTLSALQRQSLELASLRADRSDPVPLEAL